MKPSIEAATVPAPRPLHSPQSQRVSHSPWSPQPREETEMPMRNVEMEVATPLSAPGPRVAWAATGFERATSTVSLSLEALCH